MVDLKCKCIKFVDDMDVMITERKIEGLFDLGVIGGFNLALAKFVNDVLGGRYEVKQDRVGKSHPAHAEDAVNEAEVSE